MLKALRKNLRLTQAEMAERLGVSCKDYSAMERGKLYIPVHIKERICNFSPVEAVLQKEAIAQNFDRKETQLVDNNGDSGLTNELLDISKKDNYRLDIYDCYKKVIRYNLPKTILDCVNVNVIHINHGMFSEKSYNFRHYCVNKFNKDIKQLIYIDKNGLLCWKDDKCLEKLILLRKPEMDSKESVEKIFMEEKYDSK